MHRLSARDSNVIPETSEVLKSGGVIVYPTDTLYGFGVDTTNENALEKLEQIKGRGGPWSVLAPDTESVRKAANLSESEFETVKPYLIGETTVILPVSEAWISSRITGPGVGFRIPNSQFCRELSLAYPNPITSTSVNRTGQAPLNSAASILNEFGAEIDLIIDAGDLPPSKGSTIYRWDGTVLQRIRN